MTCRSPIIRTVATLALPAVLLVASTAALAADPTTINMSYNGPPDASKNAVHRFASNFKKMVNLRTSGAIKIKLYPNSQLGKEADRMEQVQSGPFIDIASLAGMQTVFPAIFAGNTPFMFDSYDAAHWFWDNSEYWDKAQDAFKDKTGAYLLTTIEEGGFLDFTNSERPIHSPDDFKGLKFRAMDESQVSLFESFGASGTPVPWTEVYSALKSGVADGQMNPPSYILIGSLQEVQKYMTMANIQYSMQFLVINGDWMDDLPKEQQQAIREAAQDASVINRIWVETKLQQRVNKIKDAGVEVYRPSKKEMQAFREQGQPAYNDWLKDKIDSKWIDLGQKSAKKAAQETGDS